MFYKLLEIVLKQLVRTSTSVKTKEVMNHGDTRWECQNCGSIKPKVAKKYQNEIGNICLKCHKELE